MIDVSGKKVKVGDTVAYIRPWHRQLCIGKIWSITPKGVMIDLGEGKTPLWRQSDYFSKVEI